MEEKKNNPPTLYEWAGGMEVFEELIVKFYDKVLKDTLLRPIFGHMSPDEPKPTWGWGEVGGPYPEQ